jgi:hypothetical protein
MNTPDHRYHLLNRWEFVSAYRTLAAAQEAATYLHADEMPCAIFDIMAHVGKPCTWNYVNHTLSPDFACAWQVTEHRAK